MLWLSGCKSVLYKVKTHLLQFGPLANFNGNRSKKSPCSRHARRLWQYLGRTGNGYRSGIEWCLGTVAVVLSVKFLLLVVSLCRSGVFSNGLGTLQQASCADVKKTDMWLHLLINVLGTLLLGASNYCMQCMTAPTRQEVDRAHQEHKWVDIGVHSTRNLARVSRSRLFLWLLLGISSIPLHLLYNSAFFSTLSYQEYDALTVFPDFFNGTPWQIGNRLIKPEVTKWRAGNGQILPVNLTDRIVRIQQSPSSLHKLENMDCRSTFGTTWEHAYNAVALGVETSAIEGYPGKEPSA